MLLETEFLLFRGFWSNRAVMCSLRPPPRSLEKKKKKQVQNKALKSFGVFKKKKKRKIGRIGLGCFFVEGAFKHCVSRTKMDPFTFVITNYV